MELNSVKFPACCVVKMAWISTSVLFYAYSKLYILPKLNANDVKLHQLIDKSLTKYYTYGIVTSIFVEIQPDSTNIKNDPRMNGMFFSMARYMIGVGFKILARTPVPKFPPSYPYPPLPPPSILRTYYAE